ncbi:hypothetical protein GCM10009853_078540 [Glycomyces scopariae]
MGVLPPRRRAALLGAAAEEFARAGYERASLNRVIRGQGMSKSSFYHYFASKEELFDAVVEDLAQAAAAALGAPPPEALAEGDFWSGVGDLTARLARLAREEPDAMRFAALFYLPDAPAGAPLAAVRAAVDAWIDRALEVGRAGGAVGDGLPLALQRHLAKAVVWAMDEWTVANAADLAAPELAGLPEAQLDALRRLLAA